MVQTQTIERLVPNVHYQKPKKPMKNIRIKTVPTNTTQNSNEENASSAKEKSITDEINKSEEVKEKQEEVRTLTTAVEDIKRRRREERLAKEKQAEEERERFVKEATERKEAERVEIIKQAKRLILYRKPMCRRINQALVVSECFRELDAQLKFRETIKNADKEEEKVWVKSMKDDIAKFEEEMKLHAEKELRKQRNYGAELKKQIEEIRQATKAKETAEFEAEKQDQININKRLTESKEYEIQKLLEKKQKLNQFFKDAIEEKKQFDMRLKQEDAFEDRANEIYRNAKTRIRKKDKEMVLKEKKERERKIDRTMEEFHTRKDTRLEMEERNFQKAVEEQEAQFQEKERIRKERKLQMRKEIQDYQMETVAAKVKQLQEEKDLKNWELMQRFKRVECDKEMDLDERKRELTKKMEYAKSLKQYMSEREFERKQERLLEEKNNFLFTKEIIEKENQKVLDYAKGVLAESQNVRPLFPILKAVEHCKKDMGLLPPKKREEPLIDTERKRRRRVPRVCTKFVPENKICYLE